MRLICARPRRCYFLAQAGRDGLPVRLRPGPAVTAARSTRRHRRRYRCSASFPFIPVSDEGGRFFVSVLSGEMAEGKES